MGPKKNPRVERGVVKHKEGGRGLDNNPKFGAGFDLRPILRSGTTRAVVDSAKTPQKEKRRGKWGFCFAIFCGGGAKKVQKGG